MIAILPLLIAGRTGGGGGPPPKRGSCSSSVSFGAAEPVVVTSPQENMMKRIEPPNRAARTPTRMASVLRFVRVVSPKDPLSHSLTVSAAIAMSTTGT